MKMSHAMQICYGGHPQLEPLIEEQRQRETAQKKSAQPQYPDFPFSLQRDFSDEPIEILIEVTGYREPHYVRGTDPRDPQNDPGSITFGDAHYLDGRECVLSELEREAAETAFWKEIL